MRRLGVQLTAWKDVATTVLVAVLLLWLSPPGHESAAPKDKINGSYKLVFTGFATGEGQANVQGFKRISFKKANLKDDAGNTYDFSADLDLDADGYRFHGTGTMGSLQVDVSGRLDPDTNTVKRYRLTALYRTDQGKAGRIVGSNRGP